MKIHSSVGLITNSSTSIYSTATQQTVKAIKEFVDTALLLAGSDRTSDDIFDIVLVPSEEAVDMAIDEAFDQWAGGEDLEEGENPAWFQHLTAEEQAICKKYSDVGWKAGKEFMPQIKEIFTKLLAGNHYETCYGDYEDRFRTLDIRITDKNGNVIPERIGCSYEHEATYG